MKQSKQSLRGFTKQHNLPYGTARAWLIDQGFDTSEGLTPEAQQAALEHFGSAVEGELLQVETHGYSLALPTTKGQAGGTEDLLTQVEALSRSPIRLPIKRVSFAGLEQQEQQIQRQINSAAERRQQLNAAVEAINERAAEIERLTALKVRADAIDADNAALEAEIEAAAQQLKEAEAKLQQL